MASRADCVQGQYVVLFFYPLDFTFVCPTEITAFSDKHDQFKKLNAEVTVNVHVTAMRWMSEHHKVALLMSFGESVIADFGHLCGLTVLSSSMVSDRWAHVCYQIAT